MISAAPSRLAAITPQSPTAPSPTTATVFPGATCAARAAWCPVPITSVSVRIDGNQGVVCTDRQDDEGSVGLRNPHRFALSSVHIARAVSASVEARAVQPASAVHTASVRPKKRRNDGFARLDRADIVTDSLDHANEFMPHA